jgi:hypothetical protein
MSDSKTNQRIAILNRTEKKSQRSKTVTLTLDRKDGKEKDLPEPYLAAATAGVALVHAVRMDRASRALAGPPPLADVRDRAAVWAKEAPSRIRSTAVRSPSWGTHSPARGPAAVPPISSGSPWTAMPLSGSRMVRG